MLVGYARTSTAEQLAGLEAQERDLKAAGAERVFKEQTSATGPRQELERTLQFVREGDTLVVAKPDRLARSTADLLRIVEDLDRRKIGLLIISMGGQPLDTRNPTSRLTLTILAAVAQFERELMLERQREGIAKAAAEGKYKGRAPTARQHLREIAELRAAGVGPVEIARRVGISNASVFRLLKEVRAHTPP